MELGKLGARGAHSPADRQQTISFADIVVSASRHLAAAANVAPPAAAIPLAASIASAYADAFAASDRHRRFAPASNSVLSRCGAAIALQAARELHACTACGHAC